jgi:hypothetical protein
MKHHYKRPIIRNKPTYKGIVFASQLEAEYAQYLDLLIAGKEIESWLYEPVTFRITKDDKQTTYTPDFRVVMKDHIEFHETKGHLLESANVKFKVAASTYPEHRWLMIKKGKGSRRKTSGWEIMRDKGGV